eukprot:751794-Hanusia_phi.AAC.2
MEDAARQLKIKVGVVRRSTRSLSVSCLLSQPLTTSPESLPLISPPLLTPLRSFRLSKEHASYQKEIDQQTEKIDKMTAAGSCNHDIKQQVDPPPPLPPLPPPPPLPPLTSPSSPSLTYPSFFPFLSLPHLPSLPSLPQRGTQGGSGVPGRFRAEASCCSGGAAGAGGGGRRLAQGERGLPGGAGPLESKHGIKRLQDRRREVFR